MNRGSCGGLVRPPIGCREWGAQRSERTCAWVKCVCEGGVECCQLRVPNAHNQDGHEKQLGEPHLEEAHLRVQSNVDGRPTRAAGVPRGNGVCGGVPRSVCVCVRACVSRGNGDDWFRQQACMGMRQERRSAWWLQEVGASVCRCVCGWVCGVVWCGVV
jgi:hypothetical protein